MDWTGIAIPDNPHKIGLCYLAGPMSMVGPPTWNYPAFAEAAERLRSAGYKVISPHELHEADGSVPWDWYLRRDLAQLIKCSRIILLPNWRKSPGAKLEHHVAKKLGHEIIYPSQFETFLKAAA